MSQDDLPPLPPPPPPPGVPESPSLKDRYEIARDHIRHEDGLINQRVTWFLAFQGLLFAALMAAFGLLDPNKEFLMEQRLFIHGVLVLLMILGFGSSIVGHCLIRAAYWHVDEIAAWWKTQFVPDKLSEPSPFPELRGSGKKPDSKDASCEAPAVTAAAMFLVLASVWGGLLAGYIVLLARIFREYAT